jgi:hypothetical protein
MQDIHASSFVWNDDMRRQYIALHAFHSTGIEGNTLSLPETHLVVDNKPLFAGFKDDSMATKVMQTSISEVRNFMQIFDALKLSHPAGHAGSWTSLSTQRLVDINSAITRDMGTPTGLRTHAVSVGHQRILLPQADEVPKLIALYLAWLNSAVKAIAEGDEFGLGLDRPKSSRFGLRRPHALSAYFTPFPPASSAPSSCRLSASPRPCSASRTESSTSPPWALGPSSPSTARSVVCTWRRSSAPCRPSSSLSRAEAKARQFSTMTLF